MILTSILSARLLHYHDQSDWQYHIWPRFALCIASNAFHHLTMRLTEFTDAISEDWGGKPFIDMINGWKYALNQHPEVKHCSSYILPFTLNCVFSQIDQERAVAAGASWGGYAIKCARRRLS